MGTATAEKKKRKQPGNGAASKNKKQSGKQGATQEAIIRYSDDDLNYFKDIINGKLETARKELVYLQGILTKTADNSAGDTLNVSPHMETGEVEHMERENIAELASRQIQFISHLEKALLRIENKTYGICRVTGKLIDKARLRAVPHATLSIEAKKAQEHWKQQIPSTNKKLLVRQKLFFISTLLSHTENLC